LLILFIINLLILNKMLMRFNTGFVIANNTTLRRCIFYIFLMTCLMKSHTLLVELSVNVKEYGFTADNIINKMKYI
jgi:hypothetical protein